MKPPPASTDASRPRVVTTDPLNVETPLPFLDGGITPVGAFYVRSNFPAPTLDAETWRLRVHGAVERPRVWTLSELQALGSTRCRMTLECAGNGRNRVTPRPPGTPWGLGAAGTGEFTGVPLQDVLAAAGVRSEATTCVFTGADEGVVEDGSRQRFQRSLALAEAMGEEDSPASGSRGPLLAWTMNDEPLTRDHGHPLRLVVPRWYAVASVKWLVDIELTDEPLHGWFQTDRYMYRVDGQANPVRTMRVRSLVTSHAEGARVPAGPVQIAGVAWSGEAPVARVEVQADEGSWTPAALVGESTTGVAVRWESQVDLAPGARTLRVRATDEAGRTQPQQSAWNELGYGNNGIHEVAVLVE